MRDDNEQTFTVFLMKFQGQKRNSIDAGVQTEPLAGAAAAEKSKWNQNRHQASSLYRPPLSPIRLAPFIPFSSQHFNLNYFNCIYFCYTSVEHKSKWVAKRRRIGDDLKQKMSLLMYFIDVNVSTSVTVRRHLMRLLRSFKLTYWGYAIDSATLCF